MIGCRRASWCWQVKLLRAVICSRRTVAGRPGAGCSLPLGTPQRRRGGEEGRREGGTALPVPVSYGRPLGRHARQPPSPSHQHRPPPPPPPPPPPRLPVSSPALSVLPAKLVALHASLTTSSYPNPRHQTTPVPLPATNASSPSPL